MYIFVINTIIIRDVSSVGSERYLDRVEVTGSNPVRLTTGNQKVIFKKENNLLCFYPCPSYIYLPIIFMNIQLSWH